MFDVSYLGALFAGLLSFASPCVLPIVPFYLSYLAGVGMGELRQGGEIDAVVRKKANVSAVFFSAGMIVVMGLHFVGAFKIAALNRQFTLNVGTTQNVSYATAFLLGLAFAFGWTPCVGPILAAILFTAAGSDTMGQGVLLLFCYGVGMTSPFILASIFIGPFLRWMNGFRQHLGKVERATGAFLIVFALLIATNSVNEIAGWMLRIAPDFWTFG